MPTTCVVRMNVLCLAFFVFLFGLLVTRTSRTLVYDRFRPSIRHTTSFYARNCLLWVALILLPSPFIGAKRPLVPGTNLRGVTRRFKAKRAKCWNCRRLIMIKRWTDSNQILPNEWPPITSWRWTQNDLHKTKMVSVRHLEKKSKNWDISHLRKHLTNLIEILHVDASGPSATDQLVKFL